MTALLEKIQTAVTSDGQPIVALYNKDERLVGVVGGWKVADGVMEMDKNIRKAVTVAELSMERLIEIDNEIARLRNLRGTL